MRELGCMGGRKGRFRYVDLGGIHAFAENGLVQLPLRLPRRGAGVAVHTPVARDRFELLLLRLRQVELTHHHHDVGSAGPARATRPATAASLASWPESTLAPARRLREHGDGPERRREYRYRQRLSAHV